MVQLSCSEQPALSFPILVICLGFEAQPYRDIGVRRAAEQRTLQNGPHIFAADRYEVGQPEPNGGVRGGQLAGAASLIK